MKRVCVFCGALPGKSPVYREMAKSLGHELARNNLSLVYGGGKVGLMGVVADAVLESGGEVVGVIPDALMQKELGHTGLTELIVVETMHERKALMAEMADAFVAMPGGFGTLDELFEVVTWLQLGVHSKPCALLDIENYFQSLLSFVDHISEEGFLTKEDRQLLLVATEPAKLIEMITNYVPHQSTKWIELKQT